MDIALFRDKGNPEAIRESQRKRFPLSEKPTEEEKKAQQVGVGYVDTVIQLDTEWRKLRTELDKVYNRGVVLCSEAIGEKKKNKEKDGEETSFPDEYKETTYWNKENCAKLSIAQLTLLSKFISSLTVEKQKVCDEKETERNKTLYLIGNLVFDEVPVSGDEDNNKVIRTSGTPKTQFLQDGTTKRLNHVDIMLKLEGMDTTSGSKVAGERGYFLKGQLLMLHMALEQFAMSFLISKSYCPIMPPFFMSKSIMSEVAQLEQFDEELYKVTGEGEDKYLIATSEQPIAAYHRQERLDEIQLPIRYAGFSTCFRKEVGSHGRDTLGIFRVHQFDKIEQFCITSPKVNEKTGKLLSEEMFEEMIGNCEQFYQALELEYQIIAIVSGKLNNAAAVKYDLEAWFPASQKFRELVSCSNCTSYQSRRLDIKFGKTSQKNQGVAAEYVHMLNCTMCAATRTLCCIVENYQTVDGVEVPKVLQPFMHGITKLLYPVKETKKKEKK